MWWKIAIAIYLLGFALITTLEATVGPVTLGLAFQRGILWPVYIFTGYPQGQRAPMD